MTRLRRLLCPLLRHRPLPWERRVWVSWRAWWGGEELVVWLCCCVRRRLR
jgi:hypothetical protein